MSLDFSQVTFGYEAQPVISNLSLAVPDGALTVLAGATGSGKSTVLKLAAGLLRPKSGTIEVQFGARVFWAAPGATLSFPGAWAM